LVNWLWTGTTCMRRTGLTLKPGWTPSATPPPLLASGRCNFCFQAQHTLVLCQLCVLFLVCVAFV
jgi:hypothetical protein